MTLATIPLLLMASMGISFLAGYLAGHFFGKSESEFTYLTLKAMRRHYDISRQIDKISALL